MLRVAFALCVVTLIGGAALMASAVDRDSRPERGAAIAMLNALPR